MEIAPPFTREELYGGYAIAAAAELEARGGRQPKVSASSIGYCSRRQYAELAGIPREPAAAGRPDGVVTTEQGRIVEDLTCAAVAAMPNGVVVRNRQICIGHEACSGHKQGLRDYPLAGHPDGELAWGKELVDICPNDGRVWGFEHKHIGRFGWKDILSKGGFAAANPAYMAQILAYGHALDWDACLVVVLGQDASSNQFEINQGKRSKNGEWASSEQADPKLMLFAYDIQAMLPLTVPLLKRAETITAAVRAREVPVREYDGKRNFPCGYCPVQRWCNEHGDTENDGLVIPPPFGLEH